MKQRNFSLRISSNLHSDKSQSSNKDRTLSWKSGISDDDECEKFLRNLHPEKPKSLHKLWLLDDDEFEKFLGLSDDELVKSPSNGGVRHSVEYEIVRRSFEAEARDNFESEQTFQTGSPGECGPQSMRSDYCVSSQESEHTIGNQVESLVSIGSVTLEERSNQSFSTGLYQGSQTSENKTHSLTSEIPMDSTHESIHDVKVKRRNILREKLLKWKIVENNQVMPLPKCVPPPYITKVIDGETLTQVAMSKGKMISIIQ
ncbi:Hypothetical predicted protein [Paramuricea clavata]|uniref:Uncharacterized protein n=1 Tax=Paramuricea clavata TaxID=317549 RepID=A0A6S7I8P8_PARCT|nr:Hypothetical predicted protein [Paramuricea clavata]